MDSFLKKINVRVLAPFIGAFVLLGLFLVTLFFSDVLQVRALPEIASSTFPYANGDVNDAVRGPGGLLYIGGNFTYLGAYTGCGVPMSKSNATLITGYDVFKGSSCNIYATIPDGSSGWYVAGTFDTVDGQSHNKIAHILSNGSVDVGFVSPDLGVATFYTLAYESDQDILFVGGSWFGAPSAQLGLAAVDGSSGALIDWVANVSDFGSVKSLALDGKILYVGGSFTALAGSDRVGLAAIDTTMVRLDATGTTTAWNPVISNSTEIRALVVDTASNVVYAGGSFSSIGGDAISYLAEISKTTGSSTGWNPNPSGWIETLKLDSGSNNIYVGGSFSTIGVGADTRNNVAAIDRTTGAVTAWDPNVDNTVFSIAIDGSNVYLGGRFTSVNSVARKGLALVDKTTAAVSGAFSANAGSDVMALSVNGSSLFAGGSFASIGGETRTRLAAINPLNGQISSWNPAANSNVYAMAADESNIYVGGSFGTIDGTTRNKVAAIGTDGTLQAWDPNISNGDVREIALDGNSVYVGGSFDTVGADGRKYIAEISKTSGVASSWNPDLTGGFNGVRSLAVSPSVIYAGGDFTAVGVDARNTLAAIDRTTGFATAWDPNPSGGFNPLATIKIGTSTLFVGGNFSTIGGQSRNNIAELDLSTGNATAWDPNASGGNVSSIDLTTTTVFVGGGFSSIGGQSYAKVAAINRYTGLAVLNSNQNLGAGMIGVPNTLLYTSGGLLLGGAFSQIGNLPQSRLGFFGPLTVGFVSTSMNVSEAITAGVITIGIAPRDTTSTQDITVDYIVTGGSANGSGIDYTLANGTATITAGTTSTDINVTVVDDATVESDETIIVSLSNAQDAGLSTDAYSATYTIVNDDVAPPGVTVAETLGSTDVTEGGGTDTYSIVLNSAPSSRVTVALASSGGNQLSLSTSSIEFSTANWNTPVTVTVTAVDDDIAESNHGSTITHTATSLDGAYDGITINTVVTHITDNADTAGVTITQSGGVTTISEAGLSDSYTVVLTSAPTSTVTVAVVNASPDMEVSTSSIEFNSVNWNQAVTVTVSPINDTEFEGTEAANITHTVTSNNGNYDAILVSSVTVTIMDNDTASTTTTNTEEPTVSRTILPPTLPVVVAPPLPPQVNEFKLELKASQPFSIGSVSHSVELLSFTDQNVTFIVHSDPIRVTLIKEKPFQLDTDNNGAVDVQVEYLGVVDNEPKIRVTSLVDENETKKAVSINKGAYKTTTSQVTLSLNVKDVGQIAISNRSDFKDSNIIPYSSNISWKLTSGVGEKTVYVRFIGSNGGAIDASDTIQYDPNNVYDPVKESEKKEQEKTQPQPYVCSLTEGKAYKSANSPVVYYIVGQKNADRIEDSTVCTKRPFKNPEIFFTYFDSYKDIQVVENAFLDAIPNDRVNFIPLGPKTVLKSGSLIKKITTSKVYVVLGSSLSWFETEKVFNGLGFTFSMIQDISHSLFSQLSEGSKIDTENNLPVGSLIQYRGDSTVYRLDMNNALVPPQLQKRKITNFETLQKIYRNDRVMQLNPTQVYPDGPDIQ